MCCSFPNCQCNNISDKSSYTKEQDGISSLLQQGNLKIVIVENGIGFFVDPQYIILQDDGCVILTVEN
jgi:hypothetical protein